LTIHPLNDYLDWPGLQQVLKRTTRRRIVKTGEVSESVICGITSLSPDKADARTLERLMPVAPIGQHPCGFVLRAKPGSVPPAADGLEQYPQCFQVLSDASA